MDLFGVAFIAFVTALGGGTVRDILLGHFPVSWTQHPEYIYLTVCAGLSTMLIARFMHHLRELFLILDAAGLVAFTIIGCNTALEMGYSVPIVIMADRHLWWRDARHAVWRSALGVKARIVRQRVVAGCGAVSGAGSPSGVT